MEDLYQHFKGKYYYYVGEAKHSETLEDFVVYRCEETGELWIRPTAMFFEEVETENYSGPRFRRV